MRTALDMAPAREASNAFLSGLHRFSSAPIPEEILTLPLRHRFEQFHPLLFGMSERPSVSGPARGRAATGSHRTPCCHDAVAASLPVRGRPAGLA